MRSLEPKSQLTNSTPMASATTLKWILIQLRESVGIRNGPEFGDEVNVVEPGFNSGWKAITGLPNNNNIQQFDADKELVKCLYCYASAKLPLGISGLLTGQ